MNLRHNQFEETISWRVWMALIAISIALALFAAKSINQLLIVEADPQEFILVAGSKE